MAQQQQQPGFLAATVQSRARDPNDPSFYVGSDGVIHKTGQGVLSLFGLGFVGDILAPVEDAILAAATPQTEGARYSAGLPVQTSAPPQSGPRTQQLPQQTPPIVSRPAPESAGVDARAVAAIYGPTAAGAA